MIIFLCCLIGFELEYDVEEKGLGYVRVYYCKVKYDYVVLLIVEYLYSIICL